ncbi:MAG: hypothetical protein LBK05_06940, partial [Treponema sp.]|nr:hypothetical protein [Treponema sp.]
MDQAIQVRNIFVPWDYASVSALIPLDGEQVCVKNAPGFTGQNRTVMGDGAHNIAWLIAQLVITPSDLQQEILAEQAERIAADAAHAALASAHGASAAPANNRIAMYGASGGLKSAKTPSEANDVIRKTEIDAEAASRSAADSAEASARSAADSSEAAVRLGQFNDLAENKQDKKPDGANSLIGSDGKMNPVYLPGSMISGMAYGGTFDGQGVIASSSYAPALQGVKIDTVDTAAYPGFYFIAQAAYIFAGNT